MNWSRIVIDSLPEASDLPSRIDALFAQQRTHWRLLKEGEAALSQVRTKILAQGDSRVIVQANPGRRRSVHAKTDPQSIARRACFLCPENLPDEERGVAFGELVILANPYPILRRHCTVTDRVHRPQRLEGRVGTMLELARAIGPEMLVFYNGPRCGASAPDHFHFQACAARGIPILRELSLDAETPPWRHHTSLGRRMIAFAHRERKPIEENISRALEILGQQGAVNEEPMINLLAVFSSGRYLTVLFPRSAHRPTCYYANGPEAIAISPATLEMAGVLVVAEPNHFDRVDVATACTIYDEVSLDESQFHQLVEAIA